MKPVHQTVFGGGKGNCFAACIASILELPIDEVPNFCGEFGDAWWAKAQDWLAGRGLFGLDLTIQPESEGGLFQAIPPSVHFIITGKSPRGDFLHCVVGRIEDERIVLVHDPHPSGAGIEGGITALTFFGALQDAKN